MRKMFVLLLLSVVIYGLVDDFDVPFGVVDVDYFSVRWVERVLVNNKQSHVCQLMNQPEFAHINLWVMNYQSMDNSMADHQNPHWTSKPKTHVSNHEPQAVHNPHRGHSHNEHIDTKRRLLDPYSDRKASSCAGVREDILVSCYRIEWNRDGFLWGACIY
jgi:hypothetical protein